MTIDHSLVSEIRQILFSNRGRLRPDYPPMDLLVFIYCVLLTPYDAIVDAKTKRALHYEVGKDLARLKDRMYEGRTTYRQICREKQMMILSCYLSQLETSLEELKKDPLERNDRFLKAYPSLDRRSLTDIYEKIREDPMRFIEPTS